MEELARVEFSIPLQTKKCSLFTIVAENVLTTSGGRDSAATTHGGVWLLHDGTYGVEKAA